MTVLGIDDDYEDLFLLKEAIGQIDPTILYITAANCIEALRILESSCLPDFIFLDINMPGINGIDFLKFIRKDQKYDRIPVTILSTHVTHDDILVCKMNRAGYLAKPTNFDVLVQEIDRILNP